MSIRFRYAVIALTCLVLSCGPEDETPPVDENAWECVDERDGWERCDGASVIWCHGTSHGNYSVGHFHEGSNCSEDGLTCVALDDQTAACSDDSMSCDVGYAACDGRQALNCVEGFTTTMRCSLAETCEITDKGARCLSLEPNEEE